MVQRPPLAVAPHPREIKDRRLARRQQRLGRELRRRVQIQRRAAPIRRHRLGNESMQMRFVTWRHLQRRRLHLRESAALKPPGNQLPNQPPGHQERPPIGMTLRRPPR